MPNYESITFNNIRKDWLYVERGRRKPPFAARRRNLLTPPGYPGGYLQSTDVEPLLIEQPIGFKVKDDEDALKKKDELAEWLLTKEPVPLELDDEPGRIYYAVVLNTIDDFDRMATLRRGTILFLCPDPYAYGPEKEFSFETDYFNIENKGTAEAEPIFELEVKEPITFAMLQNHFDEYNMIGRPIDVTDTTPFQKYERVFYSNASNDEGWTNANPGEIDGIVSGTMRSNGTRFQASSYGTGSGWHGPAIKTSLPEVLTDFRVETFVSFYNKNVAAYVGRIEIYLLDELGNSVAKLAIKDTQNGQALTVGETRLGDTTVNHYMVDEQNAYWNNFFGLLRIEREGNEWRAYIAMVDSASGRHHTRRSVRWTDTENQFTRKVAQVVIHMGKFGNHQTTTGGFYSVGAYKINQEPEGIPYIADAGDIITFDHTNNGQIYINGEPYEDTNLGSDYFTLKKGDNNIVALPDNAFGISGRYRERYL